MIPLLKLAKYAGDDKRLLDVGDAEFLQRKVMSDTQLDFTDVAEVSAAFLDALLEGETPRSQSAIGPRGCASQSTARLLSGWIGGLAPLLGSRSRGPARKLNSHGRPSPQWLWSARRPLTTATPRLDWFAASEMRSAATSRALIL